MTIRRKVITLYAQGPFRGRSAARASRSGALHRVRDTRPRPSRTVVALGVVEILGAGHLLELRLDLPVSGALLLLFSHLGQRALEIALVLLDHRALVRAFRVGHDGSPSVALNDNPWQASLVPPDADAVVWEV